MKDQEDQVDKKTLIAFFDSFKRDTSSLVNHFDTQINILIAINMGFIALSLNQLRLDPNHMYSFKTLAGFSILSVIFGLMAIHPPKHMRARRKNEDIFYNKKIIRDGEDTFCTTIQNTLSNNDEILKQYSKYFFNMFKYFYRPKRQLFKLARMFLLFGLSIGLILFLIESLLII